MTVPGIRLLWIQIKLLLWKNWKLKIRRWKEVTMMIGFAVSSMLLIGLFRSELGTMTIPAFNPSPRPFPNDLVLNEGKIAIINALDDTPDSIQKMAFLEMYLKQWLIESGNEMDIVTDISSDGELNEILQNQANDTMSIFNNDDHHGINLAIIVNEWNRNHFDYTLRLPSEWVPSTAQSDGSDQPTMSAMSSISQLLGVGQSYSTLFIPLQIWMDRFFILWAQQHGQRSDNDEGSQCTKSLDEMVEAIGMEIEYQPFWTKEREEDQFMISMGSMLPFYIVSCFLLPFAYLIKDIVEEKAAKIKEGMRIMGLNIMAFWISWLVTYSAVITIIASIVLYIQYRTAMFQHTSYSVLYALYLLYGFSIIGFAAMMTTLFDSPKTAGTVSGFIYFVLQIPSYGLKSRMNTIGIWTKMGLSVSCPTGMFMALLSIIELERNGNGYSWNNLFSIGIAPEIQNGHCLGYSMVMLCVDGMFYVAMTWILDQYLSSEYGVKLDLKQIMEQINCFNLRRDGHRMDRVRNGFKSLRPFRGGTARYKALSEQNENALFIDIGNMSDSLESDEERQSILEIAGTAQEDRERSGNRLKSHDDRHGVDGGANELHQQCTKTVSIEIRNLSKTYSGGAGQAPIRALDGVSMDIYRGECCAILGPNGAGKTTMINLLTGMVHGTSGSAKINGLSIRNEMAEIRQHLGVGVCPQTSLLWPMLTVYEHLYLFATLNALEMSRSSMDRTKSMNVEERIDSLLHDVGLHEKKGSFSSTLSGGQRRKLSVAMALMGNPEIIFLDEPTSGMDPLSRHQTWDLIERYKVDRCIVLTTHDMNEAESISDRMAIVQNGKLQIYGSSLYLKSVCGVGYNLVFTVDCTRCDAKTIRKRVDMLSHIVWRNVKNATLFEAQNVYEAIDRVDAHKIHGLHHGDAYGVRSGDSLQSLNALEPLESSEESQSSIEVVFKTAIQDSSRFPVLFEDIEAQWDSLHVVNYAVSTTVWSFSLCVLVAIYDSDSHPFCE